MAKVGIIGSTTYYSKMIEHKAELKKNGYEVKLAMFDGLPPETPNVELLINTYNLNLIKWSDIVHVFYDGRSAYALFDFGICFALNKPIKIIHLETKTVGNFLRQYEKECENQLKDFPDEKE